MLTPMNHSLRRRLLVWLLGASGIIWLAVAVASFVDSRREIEALFDLQLMQRARTLLAMGVRHDDLPDIVRRGTLEPLPPEGRFTDRMVGGAHWRTFALADPVSGARVEVGEDYALREQLASHAALRIAVPLLAGLPALAVAIWVGVGEGLRPLERLAREIGERAPDHLEPLPAGRLPDEVAPLVVALNGLFMRLDQAFENERRFTADAAHELRTPLAAIKTHVQLALRAPEGSRDPALRNVLAGVDRAAHLVDQLLALARLEGSQQPGTPVDLARLLAEVVGELRPEAERRSIDLRTLPAEPLAIAAHGGALRLLLRNLMDNAVRYTPDGGVVEAALLAEPEGPLLRIDDSGPGVPEARRCLLFERFVRGDGPSAPGCGLGLSIVQQVAKLHAAKVKLGSAPLGGLRVEVRFPVPA